MDCLVPGHAVRPLCAAITCLSRVGKELYVDFDPIDGLTLRALNDAKSVFGCFQYEPSFFDRCSAPPPTRKRKTPSRRRRDDDSDDDTATQQSTASTQGDRYSVRLALKSLMPVVRPRKNVLSLRISSSSPNGEMLEFEFRLQKQDSSAIVQVTHRIGVADAQGVAALVNKEDASELVVMPSVLLKMLDPLKRTSEMALIVNDTHKLVTTVTFHPDDVLQQQQQQQGGAASGDAPVRNNTIKTETSINYDDLVEHEYNGHPPDDDENDLPPDDIQEQVVLVLNMKEFRAMLQFCSHAYSDQELQVSASFYWGGKPLVLEASSSGSAMEKRGFKCQLVMATLDHSLLRSMHASSTTPASKNANNNNNDLDEAEE